VEYKHIFFTITWLSF